MTRPFASPSGTDEAVDRGEPLRHPARETRRVAEEGRGWYPWLARIGLVARSSLGEGSG
jgi:hypothetical protein